jgi:hypothetical protein
MRTKCPIFTTTVIELGYQASGNQMVSVSQGGYSQDKHSILTNCQSLIQNFGSGL